MHRDTEQCLDYWPKKEYDIQWIPADGDPAALLDPSSTKTNQSYKLKVNPVISSSNGSILQVYPIENRQHIFFTKKNDISKAYLYKYCKVSLHNSAQ